MIKPEERAPLSARPCRRSGVERGNHRAAPGTYHTLDEHEVRVNGTSQKPPGAPGGRGWPTTPPGEVEVPWQPQARPPLEPHLARRRRRLVDDSREEKQGHYFTRGPAHNHLHPLRPLHHLHHPLWAHGHELAHLAQQHGAACEERPAVPHHGRGRVASGQLDGRRLAEGLHLHLDVNQRRRAPPGRYWPGGPPRRGPGADGKGDPRALPGGGGDAREVGGPHEEGHIE
mmetsp:Transcript_39764/g.127110  ORF Transcript_39764/g.127110 Transcript_39764/m.127110 type:complete len:229 (-) Transcript_39764:760-1446(-)